MNYLKPHSVQRRVEALRGPHLNCPLTAIFQYIGPSFSFFFSLPLLVASTFRPPTKSTNEKNWPKDKQFLASRLPFFPSFLIMLHDNDVVCLMMLLLGLGAGETDLLWQLE